ncbi:ABC transporter permease [Caenimonas sedimenti]|uniref:ABC transporter permease n=1 Tax=Caenimonas sedimenti TaxID=2596921 RepID=A0A562ZRI1_9BURK|nr:ABC transporter permease [Caenimonas sedimenti]TWO70915.1 ABC transporter permease [Caenimonas sedimenti]
MALIVLKRLLGALPNLFGIVLITFLLTRALPGDPAAFFAGPAGTKEAVEQVREKLGLNKSLPEQFVIYLKDLSRGDLGNALSTGQPVREEIITRLPASLELVLASLLFAVVVAIPLGIAAARHPNSWIDHACRLVTTAGVSLPTFFTGLLLTYLLYFVLGWAPSPIGRLDPYLTAPKTITGLYTLDSLLAGNIPLFIASAKQMILPVLTLGIFVLAPLARMTRASMIAVLSADFVRTARASGLSTTTVLVRYAFRNALLPVVTTMGMVFSFLLGMSVIVEKVFAWPGVGSFALEALVASDYAPVQGFVLTMALLYTLLNLAIDMLYVVIDPRVRLAA